MTLREPIPGEWWQFTDTIRVILDVIRKPGRKTRVRWQWPEPQFKDRIYECTLKTREDHVKRCARSDPLPPMRLDFLA